MPRLSAPSARRTVTALTAAALAATGLQVLSAPAQAVPPARTSTYPASGFPVEPPVFEQPGLVSSTYDGPLNPVALGSLVDRDTGVEQPLCRATTQVSGSVVSCTTGPLPDGRYQAAFSIGGVGDVLPSLNSVLFRVSTAASVLVPEQVADPAALPVSGAFPYAEAVEVVVRDSAGATTAPVAFRPADDLGEFSGSLDVSSLAVGALTVVASATEQRNGSTKTATAETTTGTPTPPAATGPVLLGGVPAPGSTTRQGMRVVAFYDRPLSPLSRIEVRDSAGAVVAGCEGLDPSDVQGSAVGCDPRPSLAQGRYSVTVTARAADAPLTSTSTDAYGFEIDTVAPAVTAQVAPERVTTVTGTRVAVTGETEPDTDVRVIGRDEGPGSSATNPVLATARSGGDGRFSVELDTAPLVDGRLVLEVAAFDRARNGRGTDVVALKDTRVPQPVAVTPADGSRLQPPASVVATFDEPLAADAVVTGTAAGRAVVDGATVTFTPDAPFADGAHEVVVSVTDALGNPGQARTTFTVDGTPPPAPALRLPPTVRDRAAATGTAEPGSTVAVTLTDEAGRTATGTAVADSTGAYAADVDVSALLTGVLTGRATATDAVGNRSAASAPVRTRRTPGRS